MIIEQNKYEMTANTNQLGFTQNIETSSQTGNYIVPIEANCVCVVPPSDGAFSSAYLLKVEDDWVKLSPYDMYEEGNQNLSLKDLISADINLEENSSIGENFKYELLLEDLEPLISQSSYEEDDFLGIFVDILEAHPYIPHYDQNGKYNQIKFTSEELIKILETLSVLEIDRVISYLACEISNAEFENLLLSKTREDMVTVFKQYIS